MYVLFPDENLFFVHSNLIIWYTGLFSLILRVQGPRLQPSAWGMAVHFAQRRRNCAQEYNPIGVYRFEYLLPGRTRISHYLHWLQILFRPIYVHNQGRAKNLRKQSLGLFSHGSAAHTHTYTANKSRRRKSHQGNIFAKKNPRKNPLPSFQFAESLKFANLLFLLFCQKKKGCFCFFVFCRPPAALLSF